MSRLTQFVLMTFAFGLLMFSANSAMAQGRNGYWQDRRENRREYRQQVRQARREYREDIREARRDRWRDNDRVNGYYRAQPRGRAYGYYNNRPYYNNNNRPYYSNSNRYYYRNGRLYRRW